MMWPGKQGRQKDGQTAWVSPVPEAGMGPAALPPAVFPLNLRKHSPFMLKQAPADFNFFFLEVLSFYKDRRG